VNPAESAPPFQINIVSGRDSDLERLQVLCSGQVVRRSEGNDRFIDLPGLHFHGRGKEHEVDALLCLNQRDGYATKLYFAEQVPELGTPWTSHYILGRNWFSWSWKEVPAHQSPIAILGGHLEAFQ
jgi:hypothetical protein